jgi:hypothetical protein
MQLTKSVFKPFSTLIKLGLLAIILTFGLFLTSPAQASWVDISKDSFEAISPTFGVPAGAKPIDPRVYVANILKVVFGFLGVIAICLILYAGFSWMTAAGNDKKIGAAQDTIKAATIGLLIILAALSITVFVSNVALRANDRNANTIMQNN